MTTPRSVEPGPTAHPDDVSNLQHVKNQLAEALDKRLHTGLTVAYISQALGHRHEFMNHVREPYTRDRDGWMFDTFVDLAEGCMCIPRLDLYGTKGTTTPMWEMSRTNYGLLCIGALSVLRKVREDKGESAATVAERMNVVKSVVQRLEEADNPYMGSVQRLARAHSMIVRFRVVRSWKGDEYV